MTKRELLAYVARIAPLSLPYLEGRAINLHRFPDGADTKGFWHKELPKHAPDWLPRWDNPEADPGETTTYLVVDEPAALLWAANFGALEWHPWTSRTHGDARADVRDDRPRPGRAHHVGGAARPGPPAPDGPRPPRRDRDGRR